MDIQRWRGGAEGRNRAVRYNGMIWTVATAADTSLDLADQTAQCLETLDRNLADAGTDKTRLISAQVFLTDMSRKSEMDRVWCEWIGPDSANWPQRACVGAPLHGSTLVEIVVLAAAA
jgi:enamine deaminase RidA (YjgF/YER057c/UK114 family)